MTSTWVDCWVISTYQAEFDLYSWPDTRPEPHMILPHLCISTVPGPEELPSPLPPHPSICLLQDEWQFFSGKNLLDYVILSTQENPFASGKLTQSYEKSLLRKKSLCWLAEPGDLRAPG